jgi:pseudaminic acid biosynthesis-associated methylase
MGGTKPEDDAARLEALWAGGFGDAYLERNRAVAEGRKPFWEARLAQMEVGNALEVGCNLGANLVWLADLLGAENVAGVDVNENALEVARAALPKADVRRSVARELPFEDDSFDLVFTTMVLIHQPPDELPGVMDEIVRCSRRYVLCGEYYDDKLVEVPYRGERDALYRNDYGRLYQERYPELKLLDKGFLPRSEGVWDDVTFWVFEQG